MIEEKTWIESVGLWAENVFVDGLTLTQLYPDCISKIEEFYDSHYSSMMLDFEMGSLNLCIFSKPSVDGPTWSHDKPDPTVDEMNPLGKTEVEYEPDV